MPMSFAIFTHVPFLFIKLKVCKYQVMMQGSDKLIRTHLCDDTCYTAFRDKQKQQKLAAKNSSKASGDESCHICRKDMKNCNGILPAIGNHYLVLCSQNCFKKYQEKEGPKRCCSQCKKPIEVFTFLFAVVHCHNGTIGMLKWWSTFTERPPVNGSCWFSRF